MDQPPCAGLDVQKSNANGRFFIDLTIRCHELLLWVAPSISGESAKVWSRRNRVVGRLLKMNRAFGAADRDYSSFSSTQ